MRMQKMPMPKVTARGSITDKKKMPMPGRLGPKQVPGGIAKPYKGGGVLEKTKERLLPRRGPLGPKKGPLGPKKQVPGGIMEKRNEKLKKAYGSSLNNMQMQKAGPANLRNIQKGNRPTLKRDKQAPNFKGVFQGLAKPKPRKPLVPRRGR